MENPKYNSTIPFIDLLFLSLLGFVFMFIIAFIMMHPPQQKHLESKAEILIMSEWPDNSSHDVDVWILLPGGILVGYTNKQQGVVSLNRDDLGKTNDTIKTPEGTVVNLSNREIINIRGFPPGEYIVNIHLYMSGKKSVLPVPVIIKLIKVNPSFKTIAEVKTKLTKQGEEITAFRFTITKNNKIVDVNFVKRKFINYNL